MMPPVAILAGGLATRMRPVTERIPKSLITVARKPFLFHQLALLRRNGVTRVILCVGYLGKQIEEIVGDGATFGVDVRYSYDGPMLLGTGGAVLKALPLLGADFMLLCGDSYLDCDYAAVVEAFRSSGRLGLMTVCQNDDRWDRSNVLFRNGEIITYDKKNRTAEMRHIDYGLGAFRADALSSFAPGTVFDLQEVYMKLLRSRQLAAYNVKQRFYEIGSSEGLAESETYLNDRVLT